MSSAQVLLTLYLDYLA
jgi:hypothetical protein